MSLYDDLGVSKDATPEDIKRAYRKKAAKAHPDRASGSVVLFQKIQAAHDILMDAEARARYDQFGTTDKLPDIKGMAIQQLCGLAVMLVQQLGDVIEYTDLIFKMREAVNNGMKQGQQQLEAHPKAVRSIQLALKRLKRKKKGNDFLKNALEMTLRQTQANRQNLEAQVQLGREMLLLLEDYQYEWSASPDPMAGLQALASGYQIFTTTTR